MFAARPFPEKASSQVVGRIQCVNATFVRSLSAEFKSLKSDCKAQVNEKIALFMLVSNVPKQMQLPEFSV